MKAGPVKRHRRPAYPTKLEVQCTSIIMKTKSVGRYRAPGYPAKLEVVSDPGLLRQNTPAAWRAVPQLAGAVAFLLSANTTLCRGADKKAPNPGLAAVAPIFDHGEGRGATGCIVVAPPVFLSEEEALQVIQEEMAKGGVQLTKKKGLIDKVNTPLAEQVEDAKRQLSLQPREADSKRNLIGSDSGKRTPFEVDALNPEKHIAVEFVSADDFQRRCGHGWRTKDGGYAFSSVQAYRVKDFAAFVAERVQKEAKEKVYFGTFYDPCGYAVAKGPSSTNQAEMWKKHSEAARNASQAESKRLLRLQVQDFVKWLQAQGAI
jgi:hypothetical protein